MDQGAQPQDISGFSESDMKAAYADDSGVVLPDEMPQQPQSQGAPQAAPTRHPAQQQAPDDVQLPDERSNLENVYQQVQTSDPERAAKILSIQRKIDQPASYIDKNLDTLQNAANAPSSGFFKELEDQYPQTAQFLSDPKNMAVAHDDLPNVAMHEGLVKAIGTLFGPPSREQFDEVQKIAVNPFEYGLEGSSAGLIARGKLPDEKLATQNPNVVQRFAQGIGGLAGDFPAMALGTAIGTPVGATAGAVAGSAGGLPGIAAGVGIGGAGGGAAGAFALPAAIKATLEQQIKDGKITSYSDIVKEATEQGFVGLLTAGAGAIAKAVAPASALGVKGVAATIAPPAAEIAAMTGGQAAVKGKAPTFSDVIDAALQVGSMHMATHALESSIMARKTEAATNFYTALGETADASKIRQRLPEAHQDLVSQLTKDGPVENVYIPAEAVQSYFQSKNIDPDAAMAELGATNSYNEAKQTGGDVQIPLSTWVSKIVGTEHYQGLVNDIKFDPEDLTPRQVQERQAEIKSQVQDLVNQKAKQEKQDQVVSQVSSVRDRIMQQMEAAGLKGQEVQFSPQLHEAFWNKMGEHFGVDGSALAEQFPLNVGKFETPEEANASPLPKAPADTSFDFGANADPGQVDLRNMTTDEGAIKEIGTRERAETLEGKLTEQGFDAQERIRQAGGKDKASTRDIMLAKDAADILERIRAVKDRLPSEGERAPAEAAQAGYKPEVLQQIRSDIEGGNVEKGRITYDQDGNVTGRHGAVSTYPEYFQGKGFTKKETLRAIDNHLEGKELTEKQAKIVDDLYHASGYDKEAVKTKAPVEPFLQSSITEPEEHVYHQHQLIEGTNVVKAEFGKKTAEEATKENSDAAHVLSNKEKLERFSARFGGEKGFKKIEKAIKAAQDESKPPYVRDEKIPGSGFAPNFESKPTGTIGIDGFQEPHGQHPDPLSWYDGKYGATKDLIEKHAKEGIPLTINTSSDMVAHDDYIAVMPKDTTVRMHLMPRDAEIGRELFPGSPSLKRQETAIEKLREAGIKVEAIRPTTDQIIESAGGIEKVAAKIGVSPEEARQKVGFSAGLRALNQGAPKLEETPRGRIRIGQEGYAIDLFKNADKSTFLHETGHYFLDVMGKLAEREDAPKELKEDYQTILKHLGVSSKDEIGTEQHEKFARGFEQYLMEGKAPSSALARAFDRFRNWLTSVYKSAKNLNVDLSDDVRGVMDRMLASKEAIDSAQREAGYTAESIKGISPELEGKIRDLQAKARDQAERSLLKDQMAEITEKNKEKLALARIDLEHKVKDAVAEKPLYKAMDEAVETIGKDRKAGTIAEKFLADKLKTEDAGKFEALAEVHGFDSGEDLAQQMIMAEEGNTRQHEIDQTVEAGMESLSGLTNPEEIRGQAMREIHGEKMTELLALEREALAGLIHKEGVNQEVTRRNKAEAKIEAQAAKESARQILSDKPIKEATNSRRYITAERNVAVKAAKAMARGDYEKAAEFKRQQMLNHAIAAEAMRNESQADKSVSYLKDFAKRRADMKDMPYGFIRQVDKLLAGSGFAEDRIEDTQTLTEIAKKMAADGEDAAEIANRTGLKQDGTGAWVSETLPEMVSRVNETTSRALIMPDSVMSGVKREYADLTMQELRDLKDAVKSIAYLGKTSDRFLGDFKTMEIKQAAADFRASVEEKYGTPIADQLKPGSADVGKIGELFQSLAKVPGFFTRTLDTMLTTCHKLDGLEEGPAKANIYRPFEEAERRKLERTGEAVKELDDIYAKHFDPKEFAKYKDTVAFREDGRKFTKSEILSMALNWGNEGNRQRLMDGFGFDRAKMERIFQNLGKNDWDFCQSVWDHLDKYWPEIAKLEMDVNGVEPKGVEAAPFENAHGKYEGGYYPIAYDGSRSVEAYKNDLSRDATYKQFSTAAAHTEQGHAQARATQVNRPISLDLNVIQNHHENVIHDLEFRKAVIDVSRFLNQKDTKAAIVNAIGIKGYQGISDWVKAAAGSSSDPMGPIDNAARWFRFRSTFFNMGWRLVSAPKIAIENLVNTSSEVGMPAAFRAIKDYYFNPGTHDTVVSKSEFMKQRAEHLDRDLGDVQKKWAGTQESKMRQFAFIIHAKLDQAVSFPLWAHVYNEVIAEHGDEKLAVNQADEAVKRSFMSGGEIDQAKIMRGSELQKAFTVAYGYQSMMWNRFSTQMFEAGQEAKQGNYGQAAAVLAHSFIYTFALPAVTAALTREILRNSSSQSSPQDRKKRLAATVLEDATPLQYIPILRDAGPYLIKKSLGEQASYNSTPIESAAEILLGTAGEGIHALSTGHANAKLAEHVSNAISFTTGIPKQFNDQVFNFLDFQQNHGEATWRDFVSRKVKH